MQHGHTSICPGPQMRGGGGYGARRSLFDDRDDERNGYSSGGYGQQQPRNNFQAFGGTGVALGGGPQQQPMYNQQ